MRAGRKPIGISRCSRGHVVDLRRPNIICVASSIRLGRTWKHGVRRPLSDLRPLRTNGGLRILSISRGRSNSSLFATSISGCRSTHVLGKLRTITRAAYSTIYATHGRTCRVRLGWPRSSLSASYFTVVLHTCEPMHTVSRFRRLAFSMGESTSRRRRIQRSRCAACSFTNTRMPSFAKSLEAIAPIG